MTEDWEVRLISDSFELKQTKYDCNSTFVIFLAKQDSEYDRDVFGAIHMKNEIVYLLCQLLHVTTGKE